MPWAEGNGAHDMLHERKRVCAGDVACVPLLQSLKRPETLQTLRTALLCSTQHATMPATVQALHLAFCTLRSMKHATFVSTTMFQQHMDLYVMCSPATLLQLRSTSEKTTHGPLCDA
eukprot:1158904-Pelagomonas_calceolata.AAC.2